MDSPEAKHFGLIKPEGISEGTFAHAVGILKTLDDATDFQWKDRERQKQVLESLLERLRTKIDQGVLSEGAYATAKSIIDQVIQRGQLSPQLLFSLTQLSGELPGIDLGYENEGESGDWRE